MTIGEKIKELRIKECLTQDQLAIRLNKTTALINMWENGKVVPSLNSIRLLAEYFDVDTKVLTKLL